MNNLTDNIEYSLQQHYAAAQLLSNSSNNHGDIHTNHSNQQQHAANQQQQQQQQHQDPNAFNLSYSSFPLIRMAPPQLHQPTLAKDLTVSPPSPRHQQQPQTIIPEQVQLNHSHNNTINNSNHIIHSNNSNESRASSIAAPPNQNSNSSNSNASREKPIRVTRPPNAYLLFNKEMRKTLKDQDPTMKVAEISKEVGSRWKNMPKDQKDQYVKQANKLKEEQRALHPNSMYIRRSRAELVKAGHFTKRSASSSIDQDQGCQPSLPTVDLDSFLLSNNNSQQQPPTKKQKKTKKEKKNSNIPKHPLSAYMWYLTEVRPETMQRFPGSNVGQISKLCADRWNAMSEEARLPWNSKAQLDKERYAREMQIYALQNDHNLGRGTRQKYRISPAAAAAAAVTTTTTASHVAPHPQQLATPDFSSHSNAHQQQAATAASLFYSTAANNHHHTGHTNNDKLYHHHHHHHLSTPTSPTSILRDNPNHNPMTLNPNALLQTNSNNGTNIVVTNATNPY